MHSHFSQEASLPLDPILSLAVSVQSSPGTYAVLLGSGVSVAAGIPTGYQVTAQLVRRLAVAAGVQGDDAGLRTWFREQLGVGPSYPEVLAATGVEPAERQQVLREFFEPTLEDREAGRKVPTPAHRAIAHLVHLGYVRVIVTTNFDRLMEQALDEVGVAPAVISTPAQAVGMEPVGRQNCLLIKVHGDYLDPMIKNTPEELATYDAAVDQLLDRVFDDFGLIVSGWSAESDTALRAGIERAPSRRYTTYWGLRGEPGPVAARLIAHRRAQVIFTDGADALFGPLLEKVQAVADLRVPPPLTTEVAIATLKRYLPDPLHRIRLQDLVSGEADALAQWIEHDHLTRRREAWNLDKTLVQVQRYEAESKTLRGLLAAGVYYDDGTYTAQWSRALRRVALAADPLLAERTSLTWYPALLLLYASSLAALAADRHAALARLIRDTRLRVYDNDQNILIRIRPSIVLAEPEAEHLPEHGQLPTPFNQHLQHVLRDEMRPYLPNDDEYIDTFDLLEYLLSTVRYSISEREQGMGITETGAFAWRYVNESRHPARRLEQLAVRHENWLVQSGFFPEIAAFKLAKREVDRLLERR